MSIENQYQLLLRTVREAAKDAQPQGTPAELNAQIRKWLDRAADSIVSELVDQLFADTKTEGPIN